MRNPFGKNERLTERLDREPDYKPLVLSKFLHPKQISSSSRYEVGDLIRVPRTGGHHTLGVVADKNEDGSLVVEVRSQRSGKRSRKELDARAVAHANPLKIGDYIEIEGLGFWISGIDDEGEICVLSQSGQRVDPRALQKRIEVVVRNLDAAQTVQHDAIDRTARDGDSTFSERAPTAPLSLYRPLDDDPYVPIESIIEASSQLGLIAGNKETDTVYGLMSDLAGAAVHTDRGHNYKSWNEDGAALFADKKGRIYVGVFDQAGGEGRDDNVKGGGSAVVAQLFFDRMQASARGDDQADAVEKALVEVAHEAHRLLLERAVGEVSTYIAGRIADGRAVIVNVGDSGAMLFDGGGLPRRQTEPQGIGPVLLEGLGMTREARLPRHRTYVWAMSPGDYLVLGSDGLFDSRLEPEAIGRIVSECATAADATRRLRDVVRARMKTRQGKPDNLTVLVVRLSDAARSE